MVADGSRQPVSEGGCSGWQRSWLSADRQRLYLQARTLCEGGNESRVSGAALILSGGRWVDIAVTQVGVERELTIRRYRLIDPEGLRLPGTIPTAALAARVAAAAPLDADAVIEAPTA